jgi:hypothetical protein
MPMSQTLLAAALVAMLVECIAMYPFSAYEVPPATIAGVPSVLTVLESPHEPHGPEGGRPAEFLRGRDMPGISTGMLPRNRYLGGY